MRRIHIWILSGLLLLLFLTVSCGKTPPGNSSAGETTEGTVSSEGVTEGISDGEKPRLSRHYVLLCAEQELYGTGDAVILIAYVGYDFVPGETPELGTHKIVFRAEDGTEITPGNAYALSDYPSQDYALKDTGADSQNLWNALPVQIRFTVSADAFPEGEGKIRAEIVENAVAVDAVTGCQTTLYYASNGERVAFSIHSADAAKEILNQNP